MMRLQVKTAELLILIPSPREHNRAFDSFLCAAAAERDFLRFKPRRFKSKPNKLFNRDKQEDARKLISLVFLSVD